MYLIRYLRTKPVPSVLSNCGRYCLPNVVKGSSAMTAADAPKCRCSGPGCGVVAVERVTCP